MRYRDRGTSRDSTWEVEADAPQESMQALPAGLCFSGEPICGFKAVHIVGTLWGTGSMVIWVAGVCGRQLLKSALICNCISTRLAQKLLCNAVLDA